jgi:hypothetical protein
MIPRFLAQDPTQGHQRSHRADHDSDSAPATQAVHSLSGATDARNAVSHLERRAGQTPGGDQSAPSFWSSGACHLAFDSSSIGETKVISIAQKTPILTVTTGDRAAGEQPRARASTHSPFRKKVRRGGTSAPSPFVTQLRTSAHAIANSEGQSPGIRATTDMLERYAISFPNVTS